jgi:hypothetical protein
VHPWLNFKSLVHSKPDFFVIGVQKGGTTSLYKYLIQHPCVLPTNEKEIHFFSDKYHKGYSWYSTQFPSLLKKYSCTIHNRHRVITGEATPYYIFHPHVASRIKYSSPNAKIIIMLRNPIDRAFSHYRYHVKLGEETLSFKEAIEAESMRLQGEMEKMLGDESYSSKNLKLFSYLKRGVYIEQIKRWYELFPEEQILVLKSEDFFSYTEESYNSVLEFLGLPKYLLTAYKTFNVGKEVSMDSEMRKFLMNYFRPYNQELYKFLGKDFGWDS